jgi:dextranase
MYKSLLTVFLLFCICSQAQVRVTTDKACYHPGEKVIFSVKGKLPAGTRVRYTHLSEQLADLPLTGAEWGWSPPSTDFQGYLAELYLPGKQSLASIAVDVSSDWGRFPRYGFLSKYPRLSPAQVGKIIDNLNRHHINGLQFYDWQYKHQQPLGGSVAKPLEEWKDIGARDTYLSTVRQFIAEAHRRGMKAMSYNLIYGALDDAARNGVRDEWYLYQDAGHKVKEKFVLPAPFTSPIYLLDPASTGWQDYINAENKKLYAVLDFDGYHIDQLGNRDKPLYNFQGKPVDLPATFKPFIEAIKRAEPRKSIVMNSVNQYGQTGIAQSPADFLYTEVWPPNEGFSDLIRIVTDSRAFSKGTKQTILTAYMNYRLADHKGFFNTPSILLADAVIFAFGGAHLELGDHMLDKEYFPQDSLTMKPGLAEPLTAYYDFLVAYENLLRDAGTDATADLTVSGPSAKLAAWPPRKGFVAMTGRQVGHARVIHLLNFKDATTLDWQDNKGIQVEPTMIKNIPLVLTSSSKISKIWVASPDSGHGVPFTLPFTQQGGKVLFTLPQLKYWDMIVVE